jgi:predicted DNA-binding transcriptional regulator YafY
MANESNKKLFMFYVLDTLREHSDEAHPLMQVTIAKKIKQIYGLETMNRKTVAANILALIDLKYDIIQIKNKGYYLGERELEPSQVTYLIDAVFSSKIMTSKQSQEIAKKLSGFLSKYKRKQYNYIYKTSAVSRVNKTQLFYTIEVIGEAIEKNKKIEFDYIRSSFEAKDNSSKKIVNPYFLANNQGKYYLVCGLNEKRGLANYKVEKISNVEILEDDVLPIKNINGYENGLDIAKYVNENIYMFGGKTVKSKLLIENEYSIAYVEDWFDKNTRIYREGGKVYASVKVNEMALIYWCLQYGSGVQLLEPKTTRIKIKEMINDLNKKYKNQ